MKYFRLFILTAAAGIVLFVAFQKAEDVQNQPAVKSKINGASFVGPERPVGVEAMQPIENENTYQALSEVCWDEPWFAGGFLWKRLDRHPERGGPIHKQYAPQNKPAEQTICKYGWEERAL